MRALKGDASCVSGVLCLVLGSNRHKHQQTGKQASLDIVEKAVMKPRVKAILRHYKKKTKAPQDVGAKYGHQ